MISTPTRFLVVVFGFAAVAAVFTYRIVAERSSGDSSKAAGKTERLEEVSQVAGEIVSDKQPDISAALVEWADDFYMPRGAPVTAERYRFIQIDWDAFYRQLELSPAYVAGTSGRSPPPVYDDSPPTFIFEIFDDRVLQLLVTEVRFDQEQEPRHIFLSGEVIGLPLSTFNLSTTEGSGQILGQIDTIDFHVRVDTLRGSMVTSVAEFDRQKIESTQQPID